MNSKKLDGVRVWKEFENVSTRLNLNVIQRAVYSHLLLHTRLEGKLRLHFTLPELSRNVRISRGPVRDALHRLSGHGALKFVDRGYDGYVVEVRLPAEVPASRIPPAQAAKTETTNPGKPPLVPNLEDLDFLSNRKLRQTIHEREAGKCFYCQRHTSQRSRCLDHVVPRAMSGQNSYRNVVSSCASCNWQKAHSAAPDFLRVLFHEGRLSRKELTARLAALRALAAGKLRPRFSTDEDSGTAPPKP